jgi:uncharacterized protein
MYTVIDVSPSTSIPMIELLPLLAKIAQQYQLDPTQIHGLTHWARVMENGLRLLKTEEGDETVIRLFAIFHDACRINQSVDPGHGSRGAILAERTLGDLSLVTKNQLDTLIQACRDHTNGKISAERTIQICWDADRLDLARAAIIPNPDYLCTPAARLAQTREWASQRALKNFSPSYVKHEWEPVFIKNLQPLRNWPNKNNINGQQT